MQHAISLPSEFHERLEKIYADKATQVWEALHSPRQKSFRINTLIADAKHVLEVLDAQGISYSPIEGIPHAYLLPVDTDISRLTKLPIHQEGHIYIQSCSSLAVSVIVDPQKDELVLDLAAAPGSKTSHLAAIMENTGTIVANDISYDRLAKLRSVLRLLHVTNVVPIQFPGQVVWRDYDQTFDRVLIDAPCSMEGRIQLDDPTTVENWSMKRIKELSTRQKGLLQSAVRCAKPGSSVVYSTCTLAPEENEEVIDWILEKNPDQIQVESIDFPSLPVFPSLLSWNSKDFSPEISKTARIFPSSQWEGFFIAKLSKLK